MLRKMSDSTESQADFLKTKEYFFCLPNSWDEDELDSSDGAAMGLKLPKRSGNLNDDKFSNTMQNEKMRYQKAQVGREWKGRQK